MKQSFKAIITTLILTISSWSFEVVGFFPDYGSGFGFQLEHSESLSLPHSTQMMEECGLRLRLFEALELC